ncbi:hypothetical protein D9M68_679650 [compost metagenome]
MFDLVDTVQPRFPAAGISLHGQITTRVEGQGVLIHCACIGGTIVTIATIQQIITHSTVEQVITVTTEQIVVAPLAEDLVGQSSANPSIVPRSTLD